MNIPEALIHQPEDLLVVVLLTYRDCVHAARIEADNMDPSELASVSLSTARLRLTSGKTVRFISHADQLRGLRPDTVLVTVQGIIPEPEIMAALVPHGKVIYQ